MIKKLEKFLKENKIQYQEVSHRTVYTAYDKTATLKVKPNMIGKTLILKIDPSTTLRASADLVIALIPGNRNLDKNKFKKLVNSYRKKQNLRVVKNLGFISEKLMKNKFKGVKIGAIPPFGNLWKLQTFIDRALTNQLKIIVNSGDYNWSIKINPNYFKKLISNSVIGNFSKARK